MVRFPQVEWRRLLTEGPVIVVSILLAFWIDAWWEERQERLEEVEILLGLRTEFSRYRDELAEGIEYHAASRRHIAELLSAVKNGSWDSDVLSIDLAIAKLTDARTHDFGGGVLDALISAGRLELITNHDLRVKLASWGQVFVEMKDDEIRNRHIAENLAMPYLLRSRIPHGRAYVECCEWSDWPVPTESILDNPQILSRLLADPELEVLLELRYVAVAHLALEYEIALREMQEIIDAIDSSLAK